MTSLSEDSLQVVDASFIDSCSSSFLDRFEMLGQESGKAQQLSGPITSVEKLKHSNHTVVVFVNEFGEPDGFAKVGAKDLFFYLKNGKIVECSQAPCLLDFYVSESIQRRGIGLLLFTRALQVLGVDNATKIAYDRPSPKLLAFLSKHFNLRNGDLQPNRFMIFEGFL